MDLKNELLISLYSNLGSETSVVLEETSIKTRYLGKENLEKKGVLKNIIRENSIVTGSSSSIVSSDDNGGIKNSFLVFSFIVLAVISTIFYFGGEFLKDNLKISLFLSIIIEISCLLILVAIVLFIQFIVKKTYKKVEKNFMAIQPAEIEIKNESEDEIYYIISSTYETLLLLKSERDRQAKNSFNAALIMIIGGILIVFFGVYLLFRNNITEGALTSSIGAISNIIGGTVMKFYKDTNNRMDGINKDLFTLNTAKVQYALVLKIKDSNKRDAELSELIRSIAKI